MVLCVQLGPSKVHTLCKYAVCTEEFGQANIFGHIANLSPGLLLELFIIIFTEVVISLFLLIPSQNC